MVKEALTDKRRLNMGESMVGMKRSHRCTEVTAANIGQEVTVMGWVQKSRNKGGIIFVDLRDRSGIPSLFLRRATVARKALQRLRSSEASS